MIGRMMAEPSLAMLQVLMERMLEQQGRMNDVLERIERRLEGLEVIPADECIGWVDDFAELSEEEDADGGIFTLDAQHHAG